MLCKHTAEAEYLIRHDSLSISQVSCDSNTVAKSQTQSR